ncbi:MAG: flavodoxin family protein [Lachnospiraceae bacterium]|nr:flavodoxin family protein [Lachnospiraceae bacterium]
MKLLAINGSPREKSNTGRCLEIILEEASKLGVETELVTLSDKQIRGCRGCYGCVKALRCVVEDDFGAVFDKMKSADGIVLGSPVYHSSITSDLKSVLDRAGFSGRWAVNEMKEEKQDYAWKGNIFSGKVVAPVTVARRTGHNFAFAQVLLWATTNDCIVPGNTYWNMSVAGKGGAVNADDDAEGTGIMQALAERMVRLMKAMQ